MTNNDDVQRIEIHFAEGIDDRSWLVMAGERIQLNRGYEIGHAIGYLIAVGYAIVSPDLFLSRAKVAYYVRRVDTVAAPELEPAR